MQEGSLARCVVGGVAALIYVCTLVWGFRWAEGLTGSLGEIVRWVAVAYGATTGPLTALLLVWFISGGKQDY